MNPEFFFSYLGGTRIIFCIEVLKKNFRRGYPKIFSDGGYLEKKFSEGGTAKMFLVV